MLDPYRMRLYINGLLGSIYRIINLVINTKCGYNNNNRPIIIFPVYSLLNYKSCNKFTYYTVKFALDEKDAVYIKRVGEFEVKDYLIVSLHHKSDIEEAVVYNAVGSF